MLKKIVMTLDGFHVTEGIGGVWFYHVSRAGTNATGLCGAKTMSTQIPMSSWGGRSHLNEGWCRECANAAADQLRQAGVELAAA